MVKKVIHNKKTKKANLGALAVSLATTLSMLVQPASAVFADVLPAFFHKDSARTVFEGDIKATSSSQPLMLMPKPDKIEKEQESKEKATQNNKSSKKANKLSENEDYRKQQPKDRASILETYGNPTEEYPAAGTKDAPAPFRGLMAALNAGDEELAFKYAIQYSRYQQQVRENTRKAVAFLGQAQRREGILLQGSWPDDPTYAEYAHLQDMQLDEFEKASDQEKANIKKGSLEIQETAKNLIKQIKAGEYDLFEERKKSAEQELGQWETEERLRTRQELNGKLPVSSNGQLEIFLFFRSSDSNLQDFLVELEKLNANNKTKGQVNIAAFAVNKPESHYVQTLIDKTKASYPILPGQELSKKLGLQNTPVVIFTTNTGQSHIESGFVNYFRLDEISKIMRGLK